MDTVDTQPRLIIEPGQASGDGPHQNVGVVHWQALTFQGKEHVQDVGGDVDDLFGQVFLPEEGHGSAGLS